MSQLLTFLIALLISTSVQASGNFYAGIGVLSDGVLYKYTQSETGNKSLIGPIYYPFTFQWATEFGMDWKLRSTVSYTLMPKEAPDKSSNTSIFVLSFPFAKKLGMSSWEWAIGPAFMMNTYKGAGGTVELGNGTSTQTFHRPGKTVSSKIVALDLGFYLVRDRFIFANNFYLEAPLNIERATVAYMMTFQFQFAGGY